MAGRHNSGSFTMYMRVLWPQSNLPDPIHAFHLMRSTGGSAIVQSGGLARPSHVYSCWLGESQYPGATRTEHSPDGTSGRHKGAPNSHYIYFTVAEESAKESVPVRWKIQKWEINCRLPLLPQCRWGFLYLKTQGYKTFTAHAFNAITVLL